MSRGEYILQKPKRINDQNTSWKTFTCAILVFATICLLIIAFSWPWIHFFDREHTVKNNYESAHLHENFEEFNKSNFHHQRDYMIVTNQQIINNTNFIEDTTDIDSLVNKFNSTIYYTGKNVADPDDTTSTYNNSSNTSDEYNYNDVSSTEYEPIIHKKSRNMTNTRKSKKILMGFKDITCPDFSKENSSCQTSLCKNVASKMLSFANLDSPPCNDFYYYACHGVTSEYINVNDKYDNVLNQFKKIINKNNNSSYYIKFKKYYQQCVDYDVTNTCYANIKSLLSSVGTFIKKNDNTTEIPELTVILKKLINKNVPIFFDVRTEIDEKTKRFGLRILPVMYENLVSNILINPYEANCLKNMKSDETNFQNYIKDYKQCLYKISSFTKTLVWILKDTDVFDKSVLTLHAKEISDNLKEIFPNNQFPPSFNEFKQQYKNFNKRYTVSDLKSELPLIDWDIVLKQTIDISIDNNTEIEVYFFDYLKSLFERIELLDKRITHNTVLSIYLHKLYRSYIKDQIIANRQEYCLKLAIKFMPDISSLIYLNFFDEAEKSATHSVLQKVFEHLTFTLTSEIKTGNWMEKNEEASSKAINETIKLKLLSFITYDSQNIQTILNDIYENITFEYAFVINSDILETNLRKNMYLLYDQDPILPENLWFYVTSPFATELLTIPHLNVLVAPLGAVYQEKGLENLPYYLLMGDLGFRIATELNRYLNTLGYTTIKNSDADKSVEYTDTITDIIIDQDVLINVTSKWFLSERINDASGAELAFLALIRSPITIYMLEKNFPLPWLKKTKEELYFIHLSQQYCTKQTILKFQPLLNDEKMYPSLKINSLVMNTPQARNLFKCETNNEMKGSIKLNLDMDDYAY